MHHPIYLRSARQRPHGLRQGRVILSRLRRLKCPNPVAKALSHMHIKINQLASG